MKKKVLSLALALALCLGLAVPAMAAGTPKTVMDEAHGVSITMNEFLREETGRYDFGGASRELTIQVVADGSAVEVEALPGYKYASEEEFETALFDADDSTVDAVRNSFAHGDGVWYFWNEENHGFSEGGNDVGFALDEKWTYRATPFDPEGEYAFMGMELAGCYSVLWLCESDFARLTTGGELKAADWAQETLWKAYDAELFPRHLDPMEDDCTRGMTREEFANVTVNLYAAFLGEDTFSLGWGMEKDTPFTDLVEPGQGGGGNGTSWGWYEYDEAVGWAYNLGFVNGTGDTTFSPKGTLTREQAAVMLSRVYAKLYGDIPAVTTTSFADDAAIGSWAKSGVAFMADKGIVNGVGNSNFAPQQTLSVQEAMVMAQRMLENLK